MTPLLTTSGLTAAYGGIRALSSVSLTVEQGQAVVIVGPNGAGKTTLLRTLAGLKVPLEGTVELEGRDVTGTPAERMVDRGVAMVPEGRGVFPGLTLRDNLMLGAYHRGRDDGIQDNYEDVLRLFPALKDRQEQRAGTLSGGEQQMLAIGRGLMAEPRLLLLDEPSLGLAPIATREVIDRLIDLRNRGSTILMVEQNIRAALRLADRGYVLERGRLVLEGTSEELAEDPRIKRTYLGDRAAASAEEVSGAGRRCAQANGPVEIS